MGWSEILKIITTSKGASSFMLVGCRSSYVVSSFKNRNRIIKSEKITTHGCVIAHLKGLVILCLRKKSVCCEVITEGTTAGQKPLIRATHSQALRYFFCEHQDPPMKNRRIMFIHPVYINSEY